MSSCTAYQVCILFVLVSIIRGISGTNQVVEYQGNNYNVEITCADEPVLPWCYSSVGGWAQCGNQPTNDAFKLAAQCTPVPCKTQFSYNGITYDNSCSCDNHHISWCYKANGGWKDCGLMEKLQGMSNVYDQCECYHGEWTTWSGCDVTCGDGRHVRTRPVIKPNVPKPCSLADETEYKPCANVPPCIVCPAITGCIGQVTCTSATDAVCSQCASGYYGPGCALCPAITGCIGQVTCTSATDAVCSQCASGYYGPGCARDGGLGDWAPWTDCTKTCGGGTTTRTRQCNNPTPLNGGQGCTGGAVEQDTCRTSGCPAPDPVDDCGTSPCPSGSICIDLGGGYSCTCSPNDPSCQPVKLCRQKADVVFVIDESGSVGSINFQTVRYFFADITEELPIDMRIGAVAFATTARKVFEFTNPTIAKAEIRATEYRAGGTNIGNGLLEAKLMLDSARSGADKVIILFTDGRTTDPSYARTVAAQAESAGIKIITVGVGPNIDFALLSEISHNYNNFLQIRDWSFMQLALWNQYQQC